MSFLLHPFQQSPIALTIHPQTTELVLREGGSPNFLIGHISVVVRRTSAICALTVHLGGEQKMRIREGLGATGLSYEVVDYLRIKDTLIDVATCQQQINNAPIGGRSCPEAIGSGTQRTCHTLKANSEFVLTPGEYSFPFSLEIPADLPASVSSPLGHTSYTLTAILRRPWFQSTTRKLDGCISIYKLPKLLRSGGHWLQTHQPIQALTVSPLLRKVRIDDSWKIYIYAQSQALFLGHSVRLQIFASQCTAGDGNAMIASDPLELLEFDVELRELIVHRSPNREMSRTTESTVARTGICPLKVKCDSSVLHHQSINSRVISSLHGTVDDFPNACSLLLALPPKGSVCVQADVESPLFTVSHELSILINIRESKRGGRKHSVEFTVPITVFPDSLYESGTVMDLPGYSTISKDTLLESSGDHTSLPPPPTYSSTLV